MVKLKEIAAIHISRKERKGEATFNLLRSLRSLRLVGGFSALR